MPDIPPEEQQQQALLGPGVNPLMPAALSQQSMDGSMRWASRENLLGHSVGVTGQGGPGELVAGADEDDDDPQLFVALYDFQAGGENQLSLKKGACPQLL